MIRRLCRNGLAVKYLSALRLPGHQHPSLNASQPRRLFWNLKKLPSKADEEEQQTPTEVSQSVKQLLRSVPHALAVIVATPNEDGAQPTGMLVSSFNSVTVFPIPYISFNVKVPSATLDAIKSSRNFSATIIDSPYTADVFAQQVPNANELKPSILRPNGLLYDGYGAVSWLRCRWFQDEILKVGDHAIVVAEVLKVGFYPGQEVAGSAMVYWQGHYMQIGPHLQRTKLGTGQPSKTSGGRFRKVMFDSLSRPKRTSTERTLSSGDNPQDKTEP